MDFNYDKLKRVEMRGREIGEVIELLEIIHKMFQHARETGREDIKHHMLIIRDTLRWAMNVSGDQEQEGDNLISDLLKKWNEASKRHEMN